MNLLAKAKQAHRGELGLGVTFWLWFWLPLTAIKLGVMVLGFNVMRLGDIDPSMRLYDGLLYGSVALALALFVYFGIGVFQSAGNAESRVWRFLARAAIVLGAIGGFVNVMGLMLPNSVSDLRESVAMLNAQLPRKITDGIVLGRVGYDDQVMTFHYAWTLPPDRTVNRENLDEISRKSMCDDFKAELGSGAVSRVDAIYTVNGKDKIAVSVTGQDCS